MSQGSALAARPSGTSGSSCATNSPADAALLHSVTMIERATEYEADLAVGWPGVGADRAHHRREARKDALRTWELVPDACCVLPAPPLCLITVHRGAVDRSRGNLKPEIPAAGAHGIPLRDEIELEKHP